MKVTVLSLFPDMLTSAMSFSIIKRARENRILEFDCLDIRDFTKDRHRMVDDYQYGGGAGMVMKPEPIFTAVESIIAKEKEQGGSGAIKLILTSPQGLTFSHDTAQRLSAETRHIVILCGHYEGIDERVISGLGNFPEVELEELSIGNYILTGGELAALVIIDASVRLIPGVLGNEQSLEKETFSSNCVDYPKYTRPAVFKGMEVPAVLLSGNHKEIDNWRRETALTNTRRKRPDLLDN